MKHKLSVLIRKGIAMGIQQSCGTLFFMARDGSVQACAMGCAYIGLTEETFKDCDQFPNADTVFSTLREESNSSDFDEEFKSLESEVLDLNDGYRLSLKEIAMYLESKGK